MTTFVLVEHDNKQVNPATISTINAAKALMHPIIAFVVGYNCQSVCEQLQQVEGVFEVHCIDDATYEYALAENITPLLVEQAKAARAIVAPASTFGKNILPRVAAKLSTTMISDVIAIENESTYKRPSYAGNAVETVETREALKLFTVRPTAFSTAHATQAPCECRMLEAVSAEASVRFVKLEQSDSERPDLASADIVVSGGRGLQNKENFELIEQLADVLKAGVGASRAAVDAGFVPNDYQVGQTGKIVAPTLYIAVGISGAIQHIAGMKDAKVVVAINKDPDAPIFQVADYGLVGDLFEIIPQLIEQLQARR